MARLARLAVLLLATLGAAGLWRACRARPTLPLWDEAAHGFAGVQVADAIAHLNPIELFLAINRQVTWPFVHSLFLAPGLLLGGSSVESAEAVSLALFAGAVALIYTAGRTLHPTRGAWVGLTAAALALLAPSWRLFASLVMLEMPGAFLLLLAFVLHVRAAREPLAPRALALAGLASTALFLCKYNYGLLWLLPLAIWEWRLLPAGFRRRAWAAARERMAWRWWLRPMPALLAIGAGAIAAILVTGGGAFTLLGTRVSMRSPGNLAYALWLLGLVWYFRPRRGRGSRARRVWERLPERARILTRTIALPLAIWFTMPFPNRVKEFFGFVANRESGPSLLSADGLLFYPRAFAFDHSPAVWLAFDVMVLAVALAIAVVVRMARRRGEDDTRTPAGLAGRAMELLALALLAGLAGTVLHRYRESRFFFTVCPLLWLGAACVAVAGVDLVLRRIRWTLVREGLWGGLAAALLIAAWLFAPFERDVLERRRALRGPASLEPALDAILEGVRPRFTPPDFTVAAFEPGAPDDPNRDFPARTVLLGYGNVLSPGLLAWRARVTRPEIPRRALPVRAPYLAPGAEDVQLDTRARWLDDHADVVIVAIGNAIPQELAGEYQNEIWADRETEARIAASTAWTLVSEARLRGWKVSTYRRSR